jgi:hypothetical protein
MLSAYLVNTELDSVDPNDGLTSLREAITIANAAPGADTINFDASLAGKTILLTQGELKITDDLTVNGLGAGLLTVDASGNDPTPGWNPLPDDDSDGDGSRVFNIPNAEFPRYSVVVLRGLTITGGDSKAGGGGIYSYADLTLIDCTIVNNSARYGGGISSGSPLRMTACTIDDNAAFYGEGGGISVDDYGLVSVADSNISGNISYEGGGGIAVSGPGSIEIANTVIEGNAAVYGSGGGIKSYSSVVITSSMISGNLCDHYGGGIWARDLTMNSCTVDSNGAARAGGGVFCDSTPNQTSSSTISGSTIVNNIAYEGAGIYSAVTYLTITDVLVSDNLGGGGLQTVDGTATIANSTFSGNTTLGGGGGLRLGGPAATLTDCVIRDNVASGDYGGGILIAESDFTLTLAGCDVSNNSAADEGGGIYNDGSSLITASKITGNTARSGGGIATGYLELVGSDVSHNKAVYSYGYYCSGGGIEADQFVIENSTIRDNSAVKGGGLFSSGMGRISNSEIQGNTAKGSGGGIFIYGDLSLADTTLAGNATGSNGGAVYCRQGYTKASNCTISGNNAWNDGGGLYAESAWTPIIVSLANCTIVENYATVAGGGVFIASQKLAMHDSIVARNFSRVGADLTGVIGASFELHSSIVGKNASNGLVEAPIGAPDLNGNFIGGPVHGPIDYPLLRALAYNGGPVFLDGSKLLTMAPLSDSPLINAGDPSAMAGANGVPANDQRDGPFTRVYGGRTDMGAVESQPTPAAYFGDFNGDGSVDAADYSVWRDRMGSAVTPYASADGDGNGVVGAADYEVWKEHFGETIEQGTGVGSGGAAGSVEQGAGSGLEAGRVESGLGSEELRISDLGLRINSKAEGGGGKAEGSARDVTVSAALILAEPAVADGRESAGADGRLRLASRLVGQATAASRLQEDALLVWLAESRGAGREALGGKSLTGRGIRPTHAEEAELSAGSCLEDGGWKAEGTVCGESAADVVSSVDDVFAGLAVDV